MKLDELIESLKKLRAEHGNLPCFVVDSRSGVSDEMGSAFAREYEGDDYPNGVIPELLKEGDKYACFSVG